jgi:hypothetical protein
MTRLLIVALALAVPALAVPALAVPAIAAAQEHAHDAAAPGWSWGVDGNVFAGYNYQRRAFTDFDAWESQNWLMTSAAGNVGASRLRLSGMFSFEAFTLQDIGSPQVFQTGETFGGAPLLDYQHPHDLVMNLGAEYSRPVRGTRVIANAYLVGPAPFGPVPFMHRASAAENPQSPLSHHYLDSSHISSGVVSAGVERRGWRAEAGVFRGREPDEDRTDLDVGALDSFAARLSYIRGPWSAQTSWASLKTPERLSVYDSDRVTASLSYFKGTADRSWAWTAAFGQNREVHGNMEAYLFEATRRLSPRHAVYTRAETVAKSILDAGFHPIGVSHVHRQSQVGALTLGYLRDLPRRAWGTVGIGGDITGYLVPANLAEAYGSPLSFHVFVRYRGRAGAAPHVH